MEEPSVSGGKRSSTVLREQHHQSQVHQQQAVPWQGFSGATYNTDTAAPAPAPASSLQAAAVKPASSLQAAAAKPASSTEMFETTTDTNDLKAEAWTYGRGEDKDIEDDMMRNL